MLGQFSADVHEIWHVASYYHADGHGGGGVSERHLSQRARALRVVCTPLQISGPSWS